MGRINMALNPVAEFEFEDSETETEYKFNGGISYMAGNLLKLGIETRFGKEFFYVGPTVSHGNDQYWFAIGYLRALSEPETGKPQFYTRMILGLNL